MTVLRFATAFGLSPRMRFDLTVNEFTRELFLCRELLVYDAHTWRPYCHVQDFARLIHLVLEGDRAALSFEVFNAGGDTNNFTKARIVDAIREQVRRGTIVYRDHGSDPRNYRVDFGKVRERLGFEPAFSIQDGIAELVAGLEQHLFDRVEREPWLYGNYQIDYARPKSVTQRT